MSRYVRFNKLHIDLDRLLEVVDWQLKFVAFFFIIVCIHKEHFALADSIFLVVQNLDISLLRKTVRNLVWVNTYL